MRARRKGTNNPFVNIDKVQMQGSDILFSAEVMEFEPHTEDCIKSEYSDEYWDKLKHQAAIAAMQGMLANSTHLSFCYKAGWKDTDSIIKKSVSYADELIKQFKENKV